MTNPLYIVGPTAVGKSEIAAGLAERYGGEILGADAFQLYEGLDLLSAKPPMEVRLRVPHHLIGCVPLKESYDVARYHAAAQACMESIAARKKQAIIVGGSGMYVKSLTHGLSPLPPAQVHLREELETLDLPTLFARLQILDPVAAQAIDAKNKRRLIRAVEVCLTTGGRFSDHQSLWSNAPPAAPLGILCVRERNDLHERINRRVESIFPAALAEVRLASNGYLSPTAVKMIGFAEIQACLEGRLTPAECKDQIKAATRQYAKRQITWFKREPGFVTINLSDESNQASAAEAVADAILQSSIRETARR